MIDPCIRRAARCTSSLTLLLVILSLFFAAGITFAAAVGDQVELKATHQAGVPLHNAPGGSPKFHRVPNRHHRHGAWPRSRRPLAPAPIAGPAHRLDLLPLRGAHHRRFPCPRDIR
jgi:hypothetical protein